MKQKVLIAGGVIILLLAFLAHFYLPKSSQPPQSAEYEEVFITLERTVCYGMCPAYKLSVSGDGKVVYEGTQFVEITGRQTGQISPDQVREIIDEFYRIDYFALEDSYTTKCDENGCIEVSDLPTTMTSITIDGKSKSVENYFGAPEELRELENKIDEMTNSQKWVKGE